MADWSIYKNHGSNGKGDLTDPDKLAAAKEHLITIEVIVDGSTPYVINGYLNDPFNYSVGAQYNKIVDIPSAGNNSLMRYVKDIANVDASYHSGFFSKKIFEPGNAYSKLELKYRVYDNPSVLEQCDLLTTCCLPMISSKSPVLNTNVVEAGIDVVKSVGSVLTNIGQEAVTGDLAGMGGAALQGILDIGFTRKPPHLNIKIGSYFKKDEMVLTNVDFTFSKNFIYNRRENKKYPAFVDFTLSVESLYSMLGMDTSEDNETTRIFGTGFTNVSNTRVFIVDQQLNANPAQKLWAAAAPALQGISATNEN